MVEQLFNIGCEKVTLHVKSDNTTAIQFYISNGFTKKALLNEVFFIYF